MQQQTTLIIGANSEIAKALALQVVTRSNTHLITVSRDISFYQQQQFNHSSAIDIKDYQAPSINTALPKIQQMASGAITQIFICHGVLHSATIQPEKKLQDFSADTFSALLNANTITPMLWLQALVPLLTHTAACKLVFFNARVGSITDNRLGGWYSYRASKAALNMLLKSAAIELARNRNAIKLISFHPGTTDSPLSKPFQKNVAEGKLFSAQFVATQLLHIVEKSQFDGQLSFVDWQGEQIDW